MVSGPSFNSQKDNSARIRKKIIPDPEGKKAPDPGFATLHLYLSNESGLVFGFLALRQ
jgi:hypothetical protein